MLLRSSSVINNTYIDNSRQTTYVSGPTRSDVRGVTRRRVSTYAIQENNVPGQSLSNGQLRIFRPQVMKNNDNEQRSAPSMITNLKDVRRSSETNSTSQQGTLNTYSNRRQEQQQDAINRQNVVNQQNNVDKQNIRNNERIIQQQNAEKKNNGRREQSVNTVNSSRNIRSEESRKRFQQRK